MKYSRNLKKNIIYVTHKTPKISKFCSLRINFNLL